MNITHSAVTDIKLTSEERHGVSNHMRTDCLYNSWFRLTTKRHQSFAVLDICEENPPNSPRKETKMQKAFSCHYDEVEEGFMRIIKKLYTFVHSIVYLQFRKLQMAFLSIAKIVCYVYDKNSHIWTRRPLRRIKGLGKQLFWDRL